MADDEKRVHVTVDPTGGLMPGCVQLVVGVVVVVGVVAIATDLGKWLMANLWAPFIAIGIAVAIFGWRAYLAGESESEKRHESERLARRAKEQIVRDEQSKREQAQRLKSHQDRMDTDLKYRDAWVTETRKNLVAFEIGVSTDNPYLDPSNSELTDAEVWEHAYAIAPEESSPFSG